jgi:nucleoside-diphosphate-sugar epimerase
MKVFITGATGFVGSFIAEELLKKNYEVRCLVRKMSNLRWIADLDVECHYGSLNDSDSLLRGVEGCDYVYHAGGITKAMSEQEYFNANYEGTKNLVDACIKHKKKIKRFIYISSQTAVGPSPTILPIDETHEPNPVTNYGKSKLAGEQYVNKNSKKVAVTIVRPPAVYGPRDSDILEFFRTVKNGIIPILGGKERYLSLIHVRDLVRGIIAAAESNKSIGETYFITSQKPHSWEEISKITLKVLQKKGVKIPVPMALMKGVAVISEGIAALRNKPTLMNKKKIIDMEQEFWTCASGKAKRDFDFEVKIDLENGIRETLIWYKEHKWM